MNRRFTKEDLALLGQDLSAKLPPAAPKRKRTYEESENQIRLFEWWALACKQYKIAECLMFAIPNGSALGNGREEWQVKQRIIRGKRAKREGSRPGIPDIMLAVPHRPSPRTHGETTPHYSGMFVEMKTAKGVVSDEQEQVIGYLIARGYKCVVARSFDEARREIEDYLR